MRKLIYLSLMCLMALSSYSVSAQTPSSSEPYVIFGYLKVFPMDLGYFSEEPTTVIDRLNESMQYGYGTWRLPTNEELELMYAQHVVESNKTYMTIEKSHDYARVRLVTDLEKGAEYINLGLPSGTLWKIKNEEGGFYTYDQVVSSFGDKLPTKRQLEELRDKCEWKWTGGGYKVTGPNGNSIVLPASGERECGGRVYNVGFSGYYWSSTPVPNNTDKFCFWAFHFRSNGVSIDGPLRCKGLSVRLVQDK